MKFNRKDFITILLAFLSLSSVGIIYKNYFVKNNNELVSNTPNSLNNNKNFVENINSNEKIFVYIDGEISKPGLYEMKNDDRIKHLVDVAGGFTKDADLSKINLALKLKDEMKVHIYKIGESSNVIENNNYSNNSNLININTASKDELMKITGIGETKADKIIEFREKNRFNKIEDIIKVNGIGKKTFENIKNEITVD